METTRRFVLAAFVFLVGSGGVSADAPQRPNIVLILADDMGYECVGANCGTSYTTPSLDLLAREGMRFTHCYSQPICTPSRVQIMTGIYNHRNYLRFGLLDPGATTFAQLFQRAGYKTCVAGKWQLLGGAEGPGRFGFDEYCLWQVMVRGSRYPNPVIEQNGKVIRFTNGEYGPDVVSDYICRFMERHRAEPFLVYYPMILPHWPFEPTPDSEEWDPKAEGVLDGEGDTKYFSDMVHYTDKMVGKIAKKIEELGLKKKTLILFTTDNGTERGIRSKIGDRVVLGGKGRTTDAGTHTPLIAAWPGVIPAARVSDDLLDFSDFLPTLCEAAGIEVPSDLAVDGRSFLPQLRGERGNPREWVYCWYARNGGRSGQQFVRDQRFKLYGDGRFFDVAKDPDEERDLESHPPLSDDARLVHAKLTAAMERFKDTRPKYMEAQQDAILSDIDRTASFVKGFGGYVFKERGEIVEIKLNRSKFTDRDAWCLSRLHHLTDLSFEETPVGDQTMAQLVTLPKLEWLNLYRTRVGDEGLASLSTIRSLKHLPIGGTRVTGAGLKHLQRMRQLEYLGLRANAITDAALKHLESLPELRGLHLGETQVTDNGLEHLRHLSQLQKLWLGKTSVSDGGVEHLVRLKRLRELDLSGTRITATGLATLRAALPGCEIKNE